MAETKPQQLPDDEVIALARTSAEELSRFLGTHPKNDRARVHMDGHDLILPRHALALLRDLLAEMAQGNAVTVAPTHAELTTQQAAGMLNVSRPHLVKLLESGRIAYTKTGAHRRIRFEDVVAYKKAQRERSEKLLDELAQQAQEHGMGY